MRLIRWLHLAAYRVNHEAPVSEREVRQVIKGLRKAHDAGIISATEFHTYADEAFDALMRRNAVIGNRRHPRRLAEPALM